MQSSIDGKLYIHFNCMRFPNKKFTMQNSSVSWRELNKIIIFGKFGWWFYFSFKIPCPKDLIFFQVIAIEIHFIRSICYAKWLHKIWSFISMCRLICHVFNMLETKSYSFFLKKNSIEIKVHWNGQVNSCVNSTMYIVHEPKIDLKLVQFNWLTIIYASCKHNSKADKSSVAVVCDWQHMQ